MNKTERPNRRKHAQWLLTRSLMQPLTVVRDCLRGAAAGNRRELETRTQRRQAARNAGNPAAIFVWIPKTAGTSIYAALEGRGAQKLISTDAVERWFRQRGVVTFGHMYLPALVQAGLVSTEFFQRAPKFTVVRDPFDRAVSLFEYSKLARRLPPTTTFDIFCEYIARRAWEKVGLINHDGLIQLNPQISWVTDRHRNLFVEHVFRHEEIDRAWPKIWALVGWKGPPPPLARLNVSARNHPRNYYTPRTLDIIRDAYAADFEAFGYSARPQWEHLGRAG